MGKEFIYDYTGASDYQQTQQPYIPAAELVEAVNLAIFLKRPLLLKGEPGCGKTRLAEAVAYELGQRNKLGEGEAWPFEFWPVKSTSRARDGLYLFDAVGRLRDVQLATVRYRESGEYVEPEAKTYVRYGPLGRAIIQHPDKRTLVLIDEIDKADIDFPNDLLIELDELRFKVDELKTADGQGEQWFTTKAEPIVLITSNDEKELPDAFLRRCVFFYIEFPTREKLVDIVQVHCLPGLSKKEKKSVRETAVDLLQKLADDQAIEAKADEVTALLALAIFRFVTLRKQLQERKGEAGKRVSTSELIDWFKVLLDKKEKGVDVLARLQERQQPLPYMSVLLKNREDQIFYLR